MMKSNVFVLTLVIVLFLFHVCDAYNGLTCTCSQCSSCPKAVNECDFRDGTAGNSNCANGAFTCQDLPCLSQFKSADDACADFCNYSGCDSGSSPSDTCPTCTGACPTCSTASTCLVYGSTQALCCDHEDGCCQEGMHAYCGSCGSNLKDNSCFHEESLITYKTSVYTYAELLAGKEPECVVPHSVFGEGLVIHTSCEPSVPGRVRVTGSHLVATPAGFRPANDLRAGDIVLSSIDGKQQCAVTAVDHDRSVQKYFGLNCLHSEVLVDGVRASTFGDYHALPSMFMYVVGNIFGVPIASRYGSYLVQIYYSLQ